MVVLGITIDASCDFEINEIATIDIKQSMFTISYVKKMKYFKMGMKVCISIICLMS